MKHSDAPSLFELSNFDPGFREDPYSRWARLRHAGACVRDEMPASLSVSHHAAVQRALTDPDLLTDPAQAPENVYMAMQETSYARVANSTGLVKGVSNLDGPDHARIRTLVVKPFQKYAAAFRPHMERVVAETIAGLRGRDEFDACADFAYAVNMKVTVGVLSVPKEKLEDLKTWSSDYRLTQKSGVTAEERKRQARAVEGLWGLFAGMLAERRIRPRDDFLGNMVQSQSEGAQLTDAEIISNLMGIVAASNPTTADLIVSGIWLLLSHPDQLRRLRNKPSLVRSAVEEILRCEPTSLMMGRIINENRVFEGCPARRGDLMVLHLGAANRDPLVFEDPERFNIERKHNRHLAFGGGAHTCPGATLARQETQVAISCLLAAFPKLRFADGYQAEWREHFGFRGLADLRVRVD